MSFTLPEDPPVPPNVCYIRVASPPDPTATTTIVTGSQGDVVSFGATVPAGTAQFILNTSAGLGTVQFRNGSFTSSQVTLVPSPTYPDVSITGGAFEVDSSVTAADVYVSAGTLEVDVDGTFNDQGNFAQSGSSVLSIDLVDGQPTPIVVAGEIALGGILQLNPAMGFDSAPGTVITLIHNEGPSPVSGQFEGLPEGATVVVGNTSYVISYEGGTDLQDVVLTAASGPPSNVPVANYFTVQMGQGQSAFPINLLAHGWDSNNVALLNVLVYTQPASGATVVDDQTEGIVDYTPPSSTFVGSDYFTYQLSDGSTPSDTAVVAITVNPINHAPTGTPNTVTTLENQDYVFGASDFGFSDPNDRFAQQLLWSQYHQSTRRWHLE